MRVIMGVDGLDTSLAAVRFAGRLLSSGSDEVVLYYAPPPVEIAVRRWGSAGSVTAQLATDSLVSAVFKRSIWQLPEPCRGRAKTVVGTQRPAHGMLVAAEECHADLIVIGSRGVGAWDGWTMGSVSRAVVANAQVPVLVCRAVEATPAEHGLHVLLTFDGTDSCDEVKNALRKIHWPDSVRAEVLTVFDTLVGKVPAWLQEELRAQLAEHPEPLGEGHMAEDKRHAEDSLRAWCADLPDVFRRCTPRCVEGRPA